MSDEVETYLTAKARLREYLHTLTQHPELLCASSSRAHLEELLERFKSAHPLQPVPEGAELEVFSSQRASAAAGRQESEQDAAPPERPEPAASEPMNSAPAPSEPELLEPPPDPSPDSNERSTRGRMPIAMAVLTHEVALLLERLERVEQGSFLERIQALEELTDSAWLGQFTRLEDEPRGETAHLLVAFGRAIQVRADAFDKSRAERRVAQVFGRIKNAPGFISDLYVHGLARTHEPHKADTWEQEWRAWEARLQARLRAPESHAYESRQRPGASLSQEADEASSSSSGPATLEAVLEQLAREFPERLEVLPEAWESARQAQDFRLVSRAHELMRTLLEAYLPRYLEGGDALARQVFPTHAFAARESETTQSHERARQLRTFDYRGEAIPFWHHLRLGRGEDTRTGWRCHFHVDPERGRVVVGHCGAHLDLR